jgi:hypothetical protein
LLSHISQSLTITGDDKGGCDGNLAMCGDACGEGERLARGVLVHWRWSMINFIAQLFCLSLQPVQLRILSARTSTIKGGIHYTDVAKLLC